MCFNSKDKLHTVWWKYLIAYDKFIYLLVHPACVICSVLKSIEFSNSGGNDEVDGDISKSKSLEMLLLEKNKSLQVENTQLKITSGDVSGRNLIYVTWTSHITSSNHMTFYLCRQDLRSRKYCSKKVTWLENEVMWQFDIH